ncbi:MFS transporter [Halieaceae bacterium IMCC14734]|uniref:MFS transporter n=1 Tax=Candidatus Litorirhabdus singularis TaxID=2518993 RepID=A0ABT3TN18_9GAMM|nr:MFS transporter [Candidatus Litorirhabdus singularis]MCX2983165.1 MFS transporter [Candidatus Litorirhabdus singularis]
MPSPAPNWPFDIRRIPFFYGWVIWLVSTLGFLFSIPGQTMGMAVFTDALIDALGLTRTQLSMAYLIGTVGSALLLTRAGRWYDRWGGRTMTTLASLALALMLIYIAATAWLSEALGGSAPVGFILIMIGYFGVRFFGQGVLTSASRNVLLVWFEKRRGLVSSVRGIFVSLGFSLAPLGLAALILTWGWSGALMGLALACAGFAVFSYLLLRDSPASCGVLIDGATADDDTSESQTPPSTTLEDARRSPVFWIFALSLSIHALFGTAVTFHIISIFDGAGRTPEQAFAYFLPVAIAATSVNLLAGWLADSRRLKPFLVIMLGGFIMGAIGLLNLEADWGYWLLVAGFGGSGGLWSVISNLAFIRNFGPLHLGEISGLCTSIMVFASAIGPAMFSLGLDFFGTYAAAEYFCLLVLVLLLLAALVIPHRQEHLPQH